MRLRKFMTSDYILPYLKHFGSAIKKLNLIQSIPSLCQTFSMTNPQNDHSLA